MSLSRKLFFIPIGIPGTGKTTLARHLESTLLLQQPHFKFKKVSYDQILTEKL